MSFYLGVWKSPTAISDDEAAARYRALSDEKSVASGFDDQVYGFYSRLISLYPEVETVPEDELDTCPWASGLDVAGDHVIMAIQLEQARNIIGQIVALAAQYELVCFDPQAGKVYLPPRLETKPLRRGTAGPVYASGLQPSVTQLDGEPKTEGGDGVQANASCGILPEQSLPPVSLAERLGAAWSQTRRTVATLTKSIAAIWRQLRPAAAGHFRRVRHPWA